jgi:molecular chaperone GrpE
VNDTNLPPLEIVEAEMVPQEEAVTAEALGIDLPDDPDDAVPMLLAAVAEARTEADRYLDDLRRVAADFDNFRKRSHRDQATLIERAAERVVTALLPVLDGLDAAAAIEASTETEEKLLAGVRGTRSLLLDILAKEGLEVIPTWDQPFDPHVHEAIAQFGEGEGELTVTNELRRGYRLRGKVLRAALVEVAPGSENTPDAGE